MSNVTETQKPNTVKIDLDLDSLLQAHIVLEKVFNSLDYGKRSELNYVLTHLRNATGYSYVKRIEPNFEKEGE